MSIPSQMPAANLPSRMKYPQQNTVHFPRNKGRVLKAIVRDCKELSYHALLLGTQLIFEHLQSEALD